MSKIYAVGDVQGCAPSLKALVKKLPKKSKMIFLGDLVNRGPDSLGALRTLKSLQEAGHAECILGNHDLHLLAIDAGLRKTKGLDTVDTILNAPDRAELIEWIRHRPMALSNGNVLTVHAGVLPQWDLQQTIECAQEVEKVLRGKSYKDFLANMYGNIPNEWSNSLKGYERLRVITKPKTIKNPQGSRRPRAIDWRAGNRLARMRPPSKGGRGNRLKTNKPRFHVIPA
jgi:bis(5'-nucleosyl)-tetraphosphatase (symmetrical)